MDNNKVIYHVFRADVHFMTISMIEDIIVESRFKHFFIIVGSDNENRIYFLNLFNKYNLKNFTFIDKEYKSKKVQIFSSFFKKILPITFFKWEMDLLRFISNLEKPNILIHAECSVVFSLILSFKRGVKRNLVIWGSVHDPMNYSKSYYNLRKRLYHSYSNIVCLMSEDCNRFIKYYNYNHSVFIPYNSRFPSIADDLLSKKTIFNGNKILLGNSGRCIPYYINDLKSLSNFKTNDFTVDCMLNYGSTQEENEDLKRLGFSTFGSRFQAHTSVLSIDEYYNFMKEFDIYISSRLDQSGLGAIYLSLLLGMKLFLAGNNYLYLKNMGVIIFHTEEIENLSYIDFIKPLGNDEKKLNYSLISNLLDNKRISEQWDNFYSKMISVA